MVHDLRHMIQMGAFGAQDLTAFKWFDLARKFFFAKTVPCKIRFSQGLNTIGGYSGVFGSVTEAFSVRKFNDFNTRCFQVVRKLTHETRLGIVNLKDVAWVQINRLAGLGSRSY